MKKSSRKRADDKERVVANYATRKKKGGGYRVRCISRNAAFDEILMHVILRIITILASFLEGDSCCKQFCAKA